MAGYIFWFMTWYHIIKEIFMDKIAPGCSCKSVNSYNKLSGGEFLESHIKLINV